MNKPPKQALADFYLYLLSIPPTERFRGLNGNLYAVVRNALAKELDTDPQNVQNIFERMVEEDK